MKIIKINSRSRRDFWADYECEHCGYIDKNVESYDDSYFHNEVIPEMKCPECGKQAGGDYKPRATKYPDSQIV